MHKSSKMWVKRVLVGVGIGVVLCILGSAILYRKLYGVPNWYAIRSMTAAELAAAARRAENKLVDVQNWAAEQHAKETAATQGVATAPANSTTIEFSEDELNAFFQKWVASSGWSEKFGKYVTDPAIFLQDGRIILAGTVKEIGTVASVQFEPKLTESGKLDLKVAKVLGGNLPLPRAVWASQKDKLTGAMGRQLPQWQKEAEIAANGTANLDAVSAGLTQTLMHVLNDEPSEPVVFLPAVGHGAIPAKLTAISVTDKTMSLTVTPMTPAERERFLGRLKGAVRVTALAK